MKENAIEVITHKGYQINVFYDQSPESPREWDNLGTMLCLHRNYKLGEDHHYRTSDDIMAFIKTQKCIWLPIYMYDHSGITINTTGFSCPWDSGQLGIIYVTDERIRKEWNCKRISKQRRLQVKAQLIGEVETYDKYLRGEIYGYTITSENDNDWIGDSCWGFYDQEDMVKEAKSIIDHRIQQQKVIKKDIKEEQESMQLVLGL
jgi:hypothetical protein